MREDFEQYLEWRFNRANAMTPKQKIEVIRQLKQEAYQGKVPVGGKIYVLKNLDDPRLQAIFAGRKVSVGGVEKSATKAGEKPKMSKWARAALALGGIFVALVMVVGLMALFVGRGKGPVPTPTPTKTPTPRIAGGTHTPTATPTSTPTPAPPTATVTVTAVPYVLALPVEEPAEKGNDPASVEIAGFSFILGEGHVENGIWQPQGAEWLVGTELRRVIAVPYSPDLLAALKKTAPGEEIKLRLRSGEVVTYRFGKLLRVKRHQIEVLSQLEPSLAVVLYGEKSGERWVVVAEAEQKPEPFVEYTPVPVPVATLPATGTEVVITDSHTVTDVVSGAVLTVEKCKRVKRIGDKEPSEKGREFMVCTVSIAALKSGVAYSGLALSITELDWLAAAEGWWPEPVPVQGMIGDGLLNRGMRVTGKVAGEVQRKGRIPPKGSHPILLWERGRKVYIMKLE